MSPGPTLALGCCDQGAQPADPAAFLRPLHEASMPQAKLRGERDGEWLAFRNVAGTRVRELQSALQRAGFLPQGPASGVFEYRTLSAARLFQEYVRSVEERAEIGAPDGVVGPKTQTHLDRWTEDGRRADWADLAPDTATPAFRYWIRLLNLYHAFSLQPPINRILTLANQYAKPTDTLKLAAWQVDPAAIHLIGIRRQEWRKAPVRRNDDVFVLLLGGMAWAFYGSTDPNPREAKRPDEAYLVRGQHQYRFGWHKLGEPTRVYRAFRPVGPGVLVCRDNLNDDALTDADLAKGLDIAGDVNIHWSGSGTGNWSAGCQVISGTRYLNHHGALVDCRSFAAPAYTGLGPKTRGAYNVLLDLITTRAPVPGPVCTGRSVLYTLLYERDLDLPANAGQTISSAARIDIAGLDLEAVSVAHLVATLVDAP